MFTQVVVFATPPFALVKATFLNRTPHVRLVCFGSHPASRNHTDLFSAFSTTRHREGPSLSGRTIESSLAIPGLGLGLYLYPMGAGRKRAADVVAQTTAGPVVVES